MSNFYYVISYDIRDTPVLVLFEVHTLCYFPTILYPLLQIKVVMDPISNLFVKATLLF